MVFDLDDTLYPERDFAVSAFGAAAEWARTALGVAGLADDMTKLLDDGHLGRLFTLVLERRGIDPVHGADLIEAYRQHEPMQLDLYPDAELALSHFYGLGPLGLITDGTPAVQRAKVRALGIANRFHHIVYTHELGGRDFAKPHASSFEAMRAAVGEPGDRFVYIGDNPSKDFVSPNRMGWTTVQVMRPQRIHANAKTAVGGAAHHVVASLEALPELLKV
ncbi:MAG: HAD family hydrolase [Hyphomicrobiaceae bacterium]